METANYEGRRVLAIGLDGGTFNVLNPLIAKGKLPNLSRMMREGAWRVLHSTIPPHSAAAWSSFATGANPGRHGVYHFRAIDRGFYEDKNFSRVVNARSIALPTTWARASQAGKKVGVINVPLTYPPEPVNGFIISGMLTPRSASTFTFPPDLSASLTEYVIDADAGDKDDVLEQMDLQTQKGLQRLARILEQQLEIRTKTALELFDRYQPDLAVVVFTETDRLHHFFWPCLDKDAPCPPHLKPYTSWAEEFYSRLDASIGRLIALMGRETVCMVLSDHGFGPYPTHQFYTNAWLRDQGLLKVRSTSIRSAPTRWLSRLGLNQASLHHLISYFLPRHQVRRLRIAWGQKIRQPIDWEHTQAYFMPLFDFVGGIIVNSPTDSSEHENMCATLTDLLLALTDPNTGIRVVKKVYRREEIYKGPFIDRAPDLIFILDPSYAGDRSLMTGSPFGTMAAAARQWTGTHRSEGILLLTGPPIQPGQIEAPATMQDLAPTILHLLGLPIPKVMDGRTLDEMLRPQFTNTHPIRYDEANGGQQKVGDAEWGSPDEEAQIKERLRSLGYLE